MAHQMDRPDRPPFLLDPADLSIRALQAFIAVEETASMAEAAKRLGLSTATISQHVSNLE